MPNFSLIPPMFTYATQIYNITEHFKVFFQNLRNQLLKKHGVTLNLLIFPVLLILVKRFNNVYFLLNI